MTREELGIGKTSSIRLAEYRLKNSQNEVRKPRFAQLSSVMRGDGLSPAALHSDDTLPRSEASSASPPKSDLIRSQRAVTSSDRQIDNQAKALDPAAEARLSKNLSSPATKAAFKAVSGSSIATEKKPANQKAAAIWEQAYAQIGLIKADAKTASAVKLTTPSSAARDVWNRAIASMHGKPAAGFSDTKSADVWGRAIASVCGKQGKEA